MSFRRITLAAKLQWTDAKVYLLGLFSHRNRVRISMTSCPATELRRATTVRGSLRSTPQYITQVPDFQATLKASFSVHACFEYQSTWRQRAHHGALQDEVDVKRDCTPASLQPSTETSSSAELMKDQLRSPNMGHVYEKRSACAINSQSCSRRSC